MAWIKLGDSVDVTAVQGQRYRATVSVSKSIEKAGVLSYLQEHGWTDVQLYDDGAGDKFPPDWGDSEHDPNTDHRYIRGEGTRSDTTTTIPQSHWILTIYDLRHSYVYQPDHAPAVVVSSGPNVAGFLGAMVLSAVGAGAAWWVLRRERKRRRR